MISSELFTLIVLKSVQGDALITLLVCGMLPFIKVKFTQLNETFFDQHHFFFSGMKSSWLKNNPFAHLFQALGNLYEGIVCLIKKLSILCMLMIMEVWHLMIPSSRLSSMLKRRKERIVFCRTHMVNDQVVLVTMSEAESKLS